MLVELSVFVSCFAGGFTIVVFDSCFSSFAGGFTTVVFESPGGLLTSTSQPMVASAANAKSEEYFIAGVDLNAY